MLDAADSYDLYSAPRVFTVQPDEINVNWYWIGKLLDTVKDRDWTPLEIRRQLIQKEAQLWGYFDQGPKGIWVTKLEVNVGLVWIAAGVKVEDGLDLFREHTEPWFREKGCDRIRVIGRRGWSKLLTDFKEVATILEKPL